MPPSTVKNFSADQAELATRLYFSWGGAVASVFVSLGMFWLLVPYAWCFTHSALRVGLLLSVAIACSAVAGRTGRGSIRKSVVLASLLLIPAGLIVVMIAFVSLNHPRCSWPLLLIVAGLVGSARGAVAWAFASASAGASPDNTHRGFHFELLPWSTGILLAGLLSRAGGPLENGPQILFHPWIPALPAAAAISVAIAALARYGFGAGFRTGAFSPTPDPPSIPATINTRSSISPWLLFIANACQLSTLSVGLPLYGMMLIETFYFAPFQTGLLAFSASLTACIMLYALQAISASSTLRADASTLMVVGAIVSLPGLLGLMVSPRLISQQILIPSALIVAVGMAITWWSLKQLRLQETTPITNALSKGFAHDAFRIIFVLAGCWLFQDHERSALGIPLLLMIGVGICGAWLCLNARFRFPSTQVKIASGHATH
jgi:hypothetical protein